MIFSFFTKNAKFLLDGILIAGLVIAFFYWDPFGIFGTRVKLQSTANLITSVKEIGQLVTAEYYGEVIASWRESKVEETPPDTLNELANDLFVDIKTALFYLYQADSSRNSKIKIRRRKMDELILLGDSEIKSTFIYPYFISYLGASEYLTKENKRSEQNLLWDMYNEGISYFVSLEKRYDYLTESLNIETDFSTYYRGKINEEIEDKRITRRKELIFIGRGSVKAGFDFGQLDESRFIYDKDRAIIYFFGLKPTILDTDINPWFIPEQKIPGFQLVEDRGKLNFNDAILVKKRCKTKLREQALGAGILDKADENGKETLKKFFSLVTGTEINRVVLHTNRLAFYYDEISQDNLIDIGEIILVDSIYHNEMRLIGLESSAKLKEKKIEHLVKFLNDLQQLDAIDSKLDIPFNYFFLVAPTIMDDAINYQVLDSIEWNLMTALRHSLTYQVDTVDGCNILYPDSILEDSIWFENLGDYTASFNDFIYSMINFVSSVPSSVIQRVLKVDQSIILKLGRKYPGMNKVGEIKISEADTMAAQILSITKSIKSDLESSEYLLRRVSQLPGDSLKLVLEYVSEISASENKTCVLSDLMFDNLLALPLVDSSMKLTEVHDASLHELRMKERKEFQDYYNCQQKQIQHKDGNAISKLWKKVKDRSNKK